jgi:hypothetical protein
MVHVTYFTRLVAEWELVCFLKKEAKGGAIAADYGVFAGSRTEFHVTPNRRDNILPTKYGRPQQVCTAGL